MEPTAGEHRAESFALAHRYARSDDHNFAGVLARVKEVKQHNAIDRNSVNRFLPETNKSHHATLRASDAFELVKRCIGAEHIFTPKTHTSVNLECLV